MSKWNGDMPADPIERRQLVRFDGSFGIGRPALAWVCTMPFGRPVEPDV